MIDKLNQLLILSHLAAKILRIIAVRLYGTILYPYLCLLVLGIIEELFYPKWAFFPYYTSLWVIYKGPFSPGSLLANQLILLIIKITG